MHNDKTTRKQRLSQSTEPFKEDISFFQATLLVIALLFVGVAYITLSNQEFKLEKCKAFNNNEEAVINCYFDN